MGLVDPDLFVAPRINGAPADADNKKERLVCEVVPVTFFVDIIRQFRVEWQPCKPVPIRVTSMRAETAKLWPRLTPAGRF
jgi:hypothetical protein